MEKCELWSLHTIHFVQRSNFSLEHPLQHSESYQCYLHVYACYQSTILTQFMHPYFWTTNLGHVCLLQLQPQFSSWLIIYEYKELIT